MQIKLLSIAAAIALAFAGAAQAQQKQDTNRTDADKPRVERNTGSDRKVNEAKEDRIEADAKAAKAKCEGMKGQEKDVCQQEAKSQEKVRKAELAAQKDPSPRKQRKLEETKAEAQYEVAKAKCDMQGGKADNQCKKQAKAEYDKAKADIKAKYAKSDAKRERTAGTGATRNGDNTPNRDLNRNGR